METKYKIGIDVGSTTAKLVVTEGFNKEIIHHEYRRHHTKVNEVLLDMLQNVRKKIGNAILQLNITGSAGYGLSERLKITFVQEVVAASLVIKEKYPAVKTLIDIGGEDSKMIFFSENRVPDMRMNGSCAGGTGAFIDQIASLLNIETAKLNELAQKATHTYPIASRCGVFAKTDVQNLLSRKIPLPDIAISTFQAVVVQTMNTLARGFDVKSKVMFIGGPFKFLSELRRLFIKNLKLGEDDILNIENNDIMPAFGAALSVEDNALQFSLDDLSEKIEKASKYVSLKDRLSPLFKDKAEMKEWSDRRVKMQVKKLALAEYKGENVFLGVDSGSTTSKIVVVGEDSEMLYKFYANNNGNPIEVLKTGLRQFQDELEKVGKQNLKIVQSTVTGYGEDLIKAAFGMDMGVVETIAHYTAAHFFDPKVSFIMDIGGQDMKAIFIEKGIINRIELNESCSSGCGSFIQTFGSTLGFSVGDFASMACNAEHPADLGTRCTVFMNSKVKQSLRENATLEDISAGLAISVIKNAIYKVLKLRNTHDLGEHIVVQGGTFKNPAVHRALEVLTKKEVTCTDIPELMGAYGCALLSLKDYQKKGASEGFADLKHLEEIDRYKTKLLHCKGCVNNCTITKFVFDNKNIFYSGNKCESYFSNKGEKQKLGFNFHDYKYRLLFEREELPVLQKIENLPRIGIPRVLNIYENYSFWYTLLKSFGFELVLSKESNNNLYESGLGTIMSDNVCFPAKLVHGHILALAKEGVNRILYPLVFYQKNEFSNSDNSYNCPVVSGYSEVIKNSMDIPEKYGIILDQPILNYEDEKLLAKACFEYLKPFGVKKASFKKAFELAQSAQKEFKQKIRLKGAEIIAKAQSGESNRIVVVLAGRPYHVDPLVNHKIPQILTEFGVDVLTEDAIAVDKSQMDKLQVISQWLYPNRVYNAAQWIVEQSEQFQFVQFNSFGCGPDAIVIDEAKEILKTGDKIHTLVRIDDISSTGSVKLRLRSMLESLKLQEEKYEKVRHERVNTRIYTEEDNFRTIIGPQFSEFYSPFIEDLFKSQGYNLVTLSEGSKQTVETGLKFANNEICYPATVIIGDVIAALESGKYPLDKTAVAITQTGGQCRATSYLSLIKKAMIAAGFESVPVIAIGTSGKTLNPQPGFNLDWKKLLPTSFAISLFSDAVANMYYSTVTREKVKGSSQKIMDFYYLQASPLVVSRQPDKIYSLLKEVVDAFNHVVVEEGIYPKIGIVGEIFIKYNSFGNNHVIKWLIEQGVEVIVPPLIDFFLQDFVNFEINKKLHLRKASLSDIILFFFERYSNVYINKVNRIMKYYKRYQPYHRVRDLSRKADRIVSIANQYGEGWLIPAEIAAFASDGVNQVVSLQPFGCIANHIISKGVEKRIKNEYPDMNLLFLDFDNDISEVNIINRLHFIIKSAKEMV